MTARGVAALACVLLLAGCGFARKHPRTTLVSATTVIFAAGIGTPLSLDCDNATSTCSDRYIASVFGIGAAIGLGIGLVAVHELEIGKPRAEPRARTPRPESAAAGACRRARLEIEHRLDTVCGDRIVEIGAVHRECVCHRQEGSTGFECSVATEVTCRATTGAPDATCAQCRCAERADTSPDCSCVESATCRSAAGGVP